MTTATKSVAKPRVLSRTTRIVLLSVLAGMLMTSLWSFHFVDSVIGDNIANTLLGYNAKETPIGGAVAGAFFAFVSGLACTFTACNIAAFSAIAPLAGEKRSMGNALKPLMYMTAGLVGVAVIYGIVAALIGPSLPQLSAARLGDPETGFPVRLIQSSVVFVLIGLIFVVWGLMSLGVVRNPFAGVAARYPWAQTAFMGVLIGGFLIGRPFPLFRKMFEFAVSTQNPLYGSLAMTLQALGNVAIMVALFLLITYGTGGRFERWLTAKPGRVRVVTAIGLIVGGTFFVTYWGLRVPSIFGFGWWPYVAW